MIHNTKLSPVFYVVVVVESKAKGTPGTARNGGQPPPPLKELGRHGGSFTILMKSLE